MIRSNYIRTGALALCVWTGSSMAYAQHRKDSLDSRNPHRLGEAVVHGSQVKRVNSSAFNVSAVDMRSLRNTNLDLAHVLDRVSGVKVRENGGVGSTTNINLNGFTGKHVSGESVYGASDAVKCADGFTQVTYNASSHIFTGYIYARAASAEGLGSMQAGIRSYEVSDGTLTECAAPVKVDAFGNTGTFGTYSYAAHISKPYAMVLDDKGQGRNMSVMLTDYAIDEVNPNISNIVDLGNNQVAMVLNYSNRDSAAVAICDYDLNIKKVIYDNRIGTSVGAQRSVRYTQSGADDAGNVYVFSGSSATDSKVGALRIKKGETEFDKDYQFDILSAADGYRFRKAFHISGSKFLLEFYTDKAKFGNTDASGRMAVVDVATKSLTWVTGLPDPSTVSFGWGDGYADAYYLPVAAPTSMNGGSGSGSGNGGWSHGSSVKSTRAASTVVPTIYRIDANTGIATSFMTFGGSDLLKSITILK